VNAVRQPALEAQDLALRHPGATQSMLAGLNIVLAAGTVTAVLGPSGVGKSSLLRVLAGLDGPSAGQVLIDGLPMTGVHPRVAVAFQNPGLLPWLSLERNVAFGLGFHRQPRVGRTARHARVHAAIEAVGLEPSRHQHPAQLSGGMAQRAALARCLAREPKVLLLDEPFGALDAVTRAEMGRLLLRLVDRFHTATLLITHDIDEALLLADRVLLLGGSPASLASTWELTLPRPRDEFVAELGALRVDILQTLRAAMRRC
jgi:NitT/TauT family transport system ATP-binding protein